MKLVVTVYSSDCTCLRKLVFSYRQNHVDLDLSGFNVSLVDRVPKAHFQIALQIDFPPTTSWTPASLVTPAQWLLPSSALQTIAFPVAPTRASNAGYNLDLFYQLQPDLL